MNKKERHEKIKAILETEVITRQEELISRLTKMGLDVTQTTISRDMRDLGIARKKNKQGIYHYAVPDSESDTVNRFQGITKIDGVDHLVVLHTYPGHANAVAVSIDAMHNDSVLGTIAGDDTVLIIVRDASSAETLKKVLAN